MRCSRAGFAWSFASRVTQRRKGERTTTITPPPLHYIFITPPVARWLSAAAFEFKRSEEGEREEFITNRGLATVVFYAGFVSRGPNPAKRERE